MPLQPLRVYLFQAGTGPSAGALLEWKERLSPPRFELQICGKAGLFLRQIRAQSESVDCLVLLATADTAADVQQIAFQLKQHGLLIPTVLVEAAESGGYGSVATDDVRHWFSYHNATVAFTVAPADLAALDVAEAIEKAIALFLQVSPAGVLPEPDETVAATLSERVHLQQQRLAEKLRERLGYAGVYFKRDPERFYRNLLKEERAQLMQRLRQIYLTIVLDYFQTSDSVNRRIDEFAALAFLADLSASQVLELHMKLMDEFAKQLKLEGRSEEVLLDYRITLIDTLAHLSEMYRRSIPSTAQ